MSAERVKHTPGEWGYSINYGPGDEANYANVYDGEGQYVSNLKIHHAIAVVKAMNSAAEMSEALHAKDGMAQHNAERAFQNWWKASKYTQVIFADEPTKQVARDGFFAALDQLTPAHGVTVKPLEWEPVHGEDVETYQATCAFGFYRVFDDEDSAAGAIFVEFAANEDRFCMTDAVSIDRVHDLNSAQAAAQADYERRILSALSPQEPVAGDLPVVAYIAQGLSPVTAKELEDMRQYPGEAGVAALYTTPLTDHTEATRIIRALEAERDDLDFLLNEGGSWEAQLRSVEDRAEKAEALIAELVELVDRIPDALNASFSAGIEEREHGSARRQEKLMAIPEALRADARALISKARAS